MVQDPGNGYCNSAVSPTYKGIAEFFAKDFLRHGNKVMNLINHLCVQVKLPNLVMIFALAGKLIR
jgi:hypothetical protein